MFTAENFMLMLYTGHIWQIQWLPRLTFNSISNKARLKDDSFLHDFWAYKARLPQKITRGSHQYILPKFSKFTPQGIMSTQTTVNLWISSTTLVNRISVHGQDTRLGISDKQMQLRYLPDLFIFTLKYTFLMHLLLEVFKCCFLEHRKYPYIKTK